MNPIRAIIVDDELAARNVMNKLLQRIDIDVVELCENVPAAVEAIKSLKPDVVFLDVQMPNYAGYEIVDFFDEIDFEIIFVTAYNQYAIKAFELSAVDYLVKPINRQRLAESVEKLSNRLQAKTAAENYRLLKESMQKKELGKIVISELGNKRIVQLSDIIAIQAKGAYSNIFLSDQKELLVSKNLKHFENILPESDTFFRSHKSWIINTDYIKTFNKNKGEIDLCQDIQAKLSKYRIQEFEALNPAFSS